MDWLRLSLRLTGEAKEGSFRYCRESWSALGPGAMCGWRYPTSRTGMKLIVYHQAEDSPCKKRPHGGSTGGLLMVKDCIN